LPERDVEEHEIRSTNRQRRLRRIEVLRFGRSSSMTSARSVIGAGCRSRESPAPNPLPR
jgi:hypothetical protein